jgi:hypothetical protein
MRLQQMWPFSICVWRAAFNPDEATEQFAKVLKRYGFSYVLWRPVLRRVGQGRVLEEARHHVPPGHEGSLTRRDLSARQDCLSNIGRKAVRQNLAGSGKGVGVASVLYMRPARQRS